MVQISGSAKCSYDASQSASAAREAKKHCSIRLFSSKGYKEIIVIVSITIIKIIYIKD